MRPHNSTANARGPAAPRRGGVLLVLVIICAAAIGVWRMGLLDGLIGEAEEVAIDGAPVRRGDLRISEVVRGNLEATDSVSLKCEIEGRSTIIYLIEEGTMVEAGDLIVELDVSQLEDGLVRQEIDVKTAEAAFTKAREQYDIQVIQNESDIASAELALELAGLDLDKYTGDPDAGQAGEWDNELLKAEETVVLREEDLARAVKDLTWSEKLFAEGFVQQNEFEADKLAKKRAAIQLAQTQRDLDLIVKFGNRRRLAELQADVDTKRRDITKTQKQASARLADFEAARESTRYRLDRERQQLADLQEQVGKAKIYAPERGLLVYARDRNRWGGGDTIEEGAELRERQEIATIPREGGMTVKASIHETKLKKIETGQLCIVTVDAFPGRTFDGVVEFVAVMADSGSWRSNPNQRLYKADISLTQPTADMRPGMSCNVEILVEDLVDVHYVPRQCVFLDGGETIVFVHSGGETERRPVEVGLDNNKWVSIDTGLTEGEIVLLAPPADFEPAPIPEVESPSASDSTRGRRPDTAKERPSRGKPTEAQRAEWAKKMRDGGGAGSHSAAPSGASGGAGR